MEHLRNTLSRQSYATPSGMNGNASPQPQDQRRGTRPPKPTAEAPTSGAAPISDGHLSSAEPRRNPPAEEFLHGRVVTRIWAHATHWGAICWQVDQLRKNDPTSPRPFSRSMEQRDLYDSRQGMFAAEQWIKKAERRLTRRSRGWGW